MPLHTAPYAAPRSIELRPIPSSRRRLALARLAVLPGRVPEWHPPFRLVGLLERRIPSGTSGLALTA